MTGGYVGTCYCAPMYAFHNCQMVMYYTGDRLILMFQKIAVHTSVLGRLGQFTLYAGILSGN